MAGGNSYTVTSIRRRPVDLSEICHRKPFRWASRVAGVAVKLIRVAWFAPCRGISLSIAPGTPSALPGISPTGGEMARARASTSKRHKLRDVSDVAKFGPLVDLPTCGGSERTGRDPWLDPGSPAAHRMRPIQNGRHSVVN